MTPAATAVPAAATATSASASLRLHVPSPDWRDQIIYFVMTDRFDDGDPYNNRQGRQDHDPTQMSKYSGGDLAGLTRRLDYIQGLGATALWITPPVANMWWDPRANYGGYHGYWTENFTEVDAHLGGLEDYQRLSHGLHQRGMYLVQDIVLNHTANYFHFNREWQAQRPQDSVVFNTEAEPRRDVPAPTQWPFNLNDPRRAADRAAAIYHWTPEITNYSDPVQERRWQLADLDDLNTTHPVVRRALRQAYGDWIRKVGVDAFRVDTAFYVEPEMFEDFMHSRDPKAPGMRIVARATGRKDFLAFGEGFATDAPFDDAKSRKIERYMHGPQGQPRLNGMINFPLYGALGDAFARGRPTSELAWRIARLLQNHPRAHWMPTFVDNHDVDRFLSYGTEPGLRQALTAIFTLPGIPTLYYGTEQGFKESRAAMFARGVASGGVDHFDTSAPMYQTIRQLTTMRRANPVLSRGTPRVLQSNGAGPGVLAYSLRHGRETALVVFNTADVPMPLQAVDLGVGAGVRLEPLLDLTGPGRPLQADARGRVSALIEPGAALVWRVTRTRAGAGEGAGAGAAPAVVGFDAPSGQRVRDDFVASGRAPAHTRFELRLDGRLLADVVTDGQGRWRSPVTTQALVEPQVLHTLRAWALHDDGRLAVESAPWSFRVERRWEDVLQVADPVGDDTGPDGLYRYPTDDTYTKARPQDIQRVRLLRSGQALRVEVQMNAVSTQWNPTHGFDHVLFTLFFDLPGQTVGSKVMPLQNATLPQGMVWQRRLRVGGWSSAWFGAEGADADHEGQVLPNVAKVQVDAARRTVSFLLPPQALGDLPSLSGLKVYLNTWDYDSGYKALQPEADSGHFGGGSGTAPRWMDEVGPLTVP